MKKSYYLILAWIALGSFINISCSSDDSNNQITCTITSPDNEQKFLQGQSVPITFDVINTDENAIDVRFYITELSLDKSRIFPWNYVWSYPYKCEWNTAGEKTGSYKLEVIVKDNSGKLTSDEIVIYLKEGDGFGNQPEADFTVSQSSTKLGATIHFSDQTTNKPTQWSWDFGDGGTSASQNPSHLYSSPGNYNVSLTTTNSFGTDTESKNSYITVAISNGETGIVTDYDGNTYSTIKIGSQWWMAENLKTTHCTNGTKIQIIENTLSWEALGPEDKAMCYYENSISNSNTYGALYNYAAATSCCPIGWHLPSDEEWKQLEMYLGMSLADANNEGLRGTNQGSKLAGNSALWENSGLVNDTEFGTSGFNGLPGGHRTPNGGFIELGYRSYFWTSTKFHSTYPFYRALDYGPSEISRHYFGFDCSDGLSVRCIKN